MPGAAQRFLRSLCNFLEIVKRFSFCVSLILLISGSVVMLSATAVWPGLSQSLLWCNFEIILDTDVLRIVHLHVLHSVRWCSSVRMGFSDPGGSSVQSSTDTSKYLSYLMLKVLIHPRNVRKALNPGSSILNIDTLT